MQAACGLAQLNKLEGFIARRRQNAAYLKHRLLTCADFLQLPEATPNSDPSWFGFPLTVREGHGFDRRSLINFLDERKIGTRLLFAGNLVKQPYFENQTYRVSGDLPVADSIMRHTFWIGVQPTLGEEQLSFVADTIESFFGVNF
jgi:CDP-6-deoxy-D-xylo-4-hexulose-3-dehydrase